MRSIIRSLGSERNRPLVPIPWQNRETPAPYLPVMVPLLAHTGHWAIWGLYVIPVVIVLAATLNSFRAQRREGRQQRQH